MITLFNLSNWAATENSEDVSCLSKEYAVSKSGALGRKTKRASFSFKAPLNSSPPVFVGAVYIRNPVYLNEAKLNGYVVPAETTEHATRITAPRGLKKNIPILEVMGESDTLSIISVSVLTAPSARKR